MRKLILLFLGSALFFSCGRNKKNETEATEVKAVEKNQYSVIIDGVYEKDDSISVVYQKNKFFVYDKPVLQAVKGSTMPQRIIFNIPEGEKVENLSICVSKSKDQAFVKITNVSVKNHEALVFDGSNNKYYDLFATDPSFSWDEKNTRFNLNHGNKYPPSLVGNEKLESVLTK
jgi:hypothetical protein